MSVLKSPLHMHHPTNIKKEETPQVLPRSQASQVSATRSLYFILLNFMRLVEQFLQFSIVYADVIYHIPYTIFCGLFRNGNGFYILIMHDNFRICSNLVLEYPSFRPKVLVYAA